MVEADETPPSDAPPAGFRFQLGLVILVLGFFSPALALLLPFVGLPAALSATLGGLLVFGIPEVFTVAAVAIMGKPGFAYVKARLLVFLKRHAPPEVPSVMRYRVGLLMFVAPLIYGWLIGYWPDSMPFVLEHRAWVSAAFDLLFFSSVFVLGGQFWDKVRGLFVREARVVFPEAT